MVAKIKLREVLKFLLAIWLCSERKLKIFLVVSSGSLKSHIRSSKLGVGTFFWCNEKSNLGTCILKYLSQPRFFRGCKRFLKRISPERCPQLGEQVKFRFSRCFVTRIRCV